MNRAARAVVSVRRSDLTRTTDFEVSTESTVEELVDAIAGWLGWDGAYAVFADPPGRVLRPGETLDEAGVWDGAALTFQRPSVESEQPTAPPPAYVWKRLDLD
jgi:hypothetical protein